MANKFFVSSVVILWLTSMSWLVWDRILPSLYWSGEPPKYENYENGKAVAWNVGVNGKTVGKAASVRVMGANGTTDLHNRLHLQNFPLMELAPSWMRIAVGELSNMSFDARTRIEFDPLGVFSSFHSRISLNDLESVFVLSGRMEDSYLQLKVRAGTFTRVTPVHLPDSKALSEALFPASKLTNLKVGRSWQEEVYSPFHTNGDPTDLIRAEVVGLEQLEVVGITRWVLRVEYYSMSGVGVPEKARQLAVSWVDKKSGEVLRRDMFVGTTKLRFERVTDEEAERIGQELFDDILRHKKDFGLSEDSNLDNLSLNSSQIK